VLVEWAVIGGQAARARAQSLTGGRVESGEVEEAARSLGSAGRGEERRDKQLADPRASLVPRAFHVPAEVPASHDREAELRFEGLARESTGVLPLRAKTIRCRCWSRQDLILRLRVDVREDHAKAVEERQVRSDLGLRCGFRLEQWIARLL